MTKKPSLPSPNKKPKTKKPPTPHISETSLVTNTINMLRWFIPDGMFWRNNSGMITTQQGTAVKLAPAGTADIVGVLMPGMFVALEAKVPTRRNNVSDLQKRWIKKVQDLGGYAGVFCTVEEAIEHIQKARLHFDQKVIDLAHRQNQQSQLKDKED